MTVCFEQNNNGSRTRGRGMGEGGTWEMNFSWYVLQASWNSYPSIVYYVAN